MPMPTMLRTSSPGGVARVLNPTSSLQLLLSRHLLFPPETQLRDLLLG